jgi:hypothetical protein
MKGGATPDCFLYFGRTEHYHNFNTGPEQYGFSGPIHTSTGRAYPLREAIRGAFTSIGLKEIEDANAGDPRGLVAWMENFYEGRRRPAGVAYGLEGVRIVTEALVRRVLIEAVEGGRDGCYGCRTC